MKVCYFCTYIYLLDTQSQLQLRKYLDKYFSYFYTKTYVVGTHQKSLTEAFLLKFMCREIRKTVLFGL